MRAVGRNLTVAAKKALVSVTASTPSIKKQCELLELSRASYYRVVEATESATNLDLMNRIDELYTEYPFYGTRKMRDHLRRRVVK